jgi:ammonia channel protein AmtB
MAGFAVYYLIVSTAGILLSREDETVGSDIAMHKIDAFPEESIGG